MTNFIKLMNIPIALETLIESIEALSLEEQALLFEQLYRRRIEKQRRKNTKKTADTIEALPADNTPTTSKSNQPQNPLLMVPATLKNNPLFDEVIGYMETYRRELDKETEADYRELDAEAQAKWLDTFSTLTMSPSCNKFIQSLRSASVQLILSILV